MNEIKQLLDNHVKQRNCVGELCEQRPDPLIVAKKFNDEYISLLCSVFAYGKASLIVKFLQSLDFSLLDASDEQIVQELKGHYYRFQTSQDVIDIFLAIKRLKNTDSLNSVFLEGYQKNGCVLEGIKQIVEKLYDLSNSSTDGYKFLIGTTPFYNKLGRIETKNISPYKRWNMFLRWMVRFDNLDMGLWRGVDKKDLILPLDTHTFDVSRKLGLLDRNTYDLKSAVLITDRLREFDSSDPIKYDFAIYRIGQEKIDINKRILSPPNK